MTDDFVENIRQAIARLQALLPHAEAIESELHDLLGELHKLPLDPDPRRKDFDTVRVLLVAGQRLFQWLHLTETLEEAIGKLKAAIEPKREGRRDA